MNVLSDFHEFTKIVDVLDKQWRILFSKYFEIQFIVNESKYVIFVPKQEIFSLNS